LNSLATELPSAWSSSISFSLGVAGLLGVAAPYVVTDGADSGGRSPRVFSSTDMIRRPTQSRQSTTNPIGKSNDRILILSPASCRSDFRAMAKVWSSKAYPGDIISILSNGAPYFKVLFY
jgi:hypothetical protein